MPLLAGLGGNLAMGVAFQLKDEFSSTADGIKKSMRDLDQYTEQMAWKVDAAMSKIRTGFAMTAVGAAMLAPGIMAVKKAGEFEQFGIALETMLGDVDRAKKMMGDLDQFAKTTPFEIGPLRENAKQLLAYNIEADKLIPTLTTLGNIASGVGADKFPRLVMALGQVRAKGKLMGEELRQFTETGIPLLDELSKISGIGVKDLAGDVAKYALPFEMVEQALTNLASKGGKFDNLMARQAQSIGGQWSNMLDSMNLGLQSWGMQLLPLAKKVVGFLQKLTEGFKRLAENPIGAFILKTITVLGAFLVVAGLAMIVVGGLRFAIYKAAGAFGDMTKATILQTIHTKGARAGLLAMGRAAWASLGPYALIAAAIIGIVYALKKLSDGLKSANPAVMALAGSILILMGPIGWIIGAFTLFKRAVKEFDSMDIAGGQGLSGGIMGYLQRLGGIIRGVMALWSSWDEQTQTFTIGEDLYNKLNALGLWETVKNIGTWIARIKTFVAGMADGFLQAFRDAKKFVMDFIESLMPVQERLGKMGTLVEAAKSSMERWRNAGKTVGYVLAGALIGLVALFTLLGIVALVALGAILVGIVLIALPFIAVGYLIRKLVDGLFWLQQKIQDVKTAIMVWVVSSLGYLWTLWNSIVTGFSTAWNSVVTFFSGLWERVSTVFSNAAQAAWNWIASTVNAVTSGFSSMWTTITAWGSNVVNWFLSLPSVIYNAGASMVSRLLAGIQSGWGALKSWLINAVKGIPLLGSIAGMIGSGIDAVTGAGGTSPAVQPASAGRMSIPGPTRDAMVSSQAVGTASRVAASRAPAAQAPAPILQPVQVTRTNIIKIGDSELGRFIERENEDSYSRDNG